jgi:hypothetical protein
MAAITVALSRTSPLLPEGASVVAESPELDSGGSRSWKSANAC